MKRILYTVIVLLVFTNIMVAQLGVGTEAPNTSSQLEVVSADRGILIPRIELESTTDQSTIRNGNVNSLMVFNTQTVNDVSPGYYYWYVDKWYKLATTAGEIITTLIDNENGTYLYTSEDGTQTLIDIPTSVVNDIINQGDVYTEIINLIDTNETVTIIEDHGNGTYTYYNENEIDANGTIIGAGVTIDVVGDVVTNIQNQGDIYDEIINILVAESDIFVDNGDGTFTHTTVDGDVQTFDANTTTMVNNGDGTYTFTNANGDTITVDVIGDVVTNIQNGGDIYNEIINLIDLNETITTIVDNGDGTITYTNEAGAIVIIDLAAGPKGDDGDTPTIGANGNWEIGGVDTGIAATGPKGDKGDKGDHGDDGDTPTIGANGNWEIGGVDTGIAATGQKGDKGDDGDTPTMGANGRSEERRE